MPARTKDYPCLRCTEHVKHRSESVECTMCNNWVHVKCEPDLTVDTYRALCAAAELRKAGGKSSLHWSCASCSSYASKFNTSILELHMRLTKVEANCSENSKDIEMVQKDVNALQEKVEAISTDSITKNSSATIFNELREREQRKNNIIIYNVPEPTGNNKDERKENDMKNLQSICADINVELNLDEECKFITRLGLYNKERKRPMLVGFHKNDIKTLILRNSNKLHNKRENVKISHDLTNQQRNEEKNLEGEAEAKNEERTEEQRKYFKYQVVGRKGEKRVARVPLEDVGVRESSRGTWSSRTRPERRRSTERDASPARQPPWRSRTPVVETRMSRSPVARGSSSGSSEGEPSPKRKK